MEATKSLLDLVAKLAELVRGQYEEVERAMIKTGDYKLDQYEEVEREPRLTPGTTN